MGNTIKLAQNCTTNHLGEYYYSTDEFGKKRFKFQVMSKLGISETTFYRWISGSQKPSKLEAEAIAELCGISATILYPHHYITQI